MEGFRSWQSTYPSERQRDDLTSAAVYLAIRSRSVGYGTMATFVAALAFERFGRKPKESCKWAVLDEMVRGKKRSESRRQQKFATLEEVRILLTETHRSGWPLWRNDRIRVLLSLLFYGLLRISEAINITQENIKDEGSVWSFRIVRSKTDQLSTGASIYVQKADWFDAALIRCCARTEDGPILTGENGYLHCSFALIML
ncbi:protein kinase A anchor [Oesophagostomum dentatum]|uniref:Protein kinase A anchor n=1 Tax=Oesophagostomum dentatum TaxID=61180 RepID=A0A0B1T6C4_OESDE|nr:protein kinase A anchor [Oesophagostomum dentatum]